MGDLSVPAVAVMSTAFAVFSLKALDYVVEMSRRRWDDRQKARMKCLEAAAALAKAALLTAPSGDAGSAETQVSSAISELRIYGAGDEVLTKAQKVLEALTPPESAASGAEAADRRLLTAVHAFTGQVRRDFRTGAD